MADLASLRTLSISVLLCFRSCVGTVGTVGLFLGCEREKALAKIEMRPDNIETEVWWLYWVERAELVGRVERDLGGRCTVSPQGPSWSPMKSIGRSFADPADALREVQLYFENR